jgi:hypothetical protein
MNNKLIAFGLFTIISITLPSYILVNKSGKVGFTGSPGELACNNCHNSFALNSGTGSIKITTNIPNDQYAPNTTYQVSVTVAKPGTFLFGFGLEVLNGSNTNAGTLTVTDAVHTQKLNAANGRTNMTHKLNGGASADSAVFGFNWTSPATDEGSISFYYTGVCANANNANSLDNVYKSSHTITPSSIFGLEGEIPYSDLRIISSSDNQTVNVVFQLDDEADVWLNLLALDGKQITQASYFAQAPGKKSLALNTQGLNTGVYILQARINTTNINRKFLLVQ